MKTEKEIMIAGDMYNPMDEELVQDRMATRLLIQDLNACREDDAQKRGQIVKQLVPQAGLNFYIQPPFYCDYGYNMEVGDNVFFNFNCIVLDVAPVRIGSRTMFGPNVQVYTATHPLNHVQRSSGREYARPINIGDDVWIGGSAVICPGVTIGHRSVIGAGSVVTKDIPNDVFAAGNPCRVIRQLNPDEQQQA